MVSIKVSDHLWVYNQVRLATGDYTINSIFTITVYKYFDKCRNFCILFLFSIFCTSCM